MDHVDSDRGIDLSVVCRVESPGMGQGDRPAGVVTDLIWQLKGMFNAAEVVQQVGDVPLTLVAGGLKVSFISLIYALLIYAASLVIRMLQKPRI